MLGLNEKKHETINGREIMMSPANTNHLRIQGNLHAILWHYLKGKRCQVFFEHTVVFAADFWLQPDILIVCDRKKIKRTFIDGAPDFIAEILSPATETRDVGIKKDTYEKHGVKEYWIIDPEKKSITVYLLHGGKYVVDNIYRIFKETDWDDLSADEKARQKLSLKLSLYDDLEIDAREVFQGQYGDGDTEA